MILTKSFLNEQVQKRNIKDSIGFCFEHKQVRDEYDVFISYSWNDKPYALKVVQLLEKCGYTVYIDYRDKDLDRNIVNEQTAKTLVERMKKCKGLLYLYSPSSSVSKWCPWEMGVFSGIKNFRCANLPIVDKEGDNYKHQEYLEIYPHIEYARNEDSIYDFWVCENDNKYTTLKRWINGGQLTEH